MYTRDTNRPTTTFFRKVLTEYFCEKGFLSTVYRTSEPSTCPTTYILKRLDFCLAHHKSLRLTVSLRLFLFFSKTFLNFLIVRQIFMISVKKSMSCFWFPFLSNIFHSLLSDGRVFWLRNKNHRSDHVIFKFSVLKTGPETVTGRCTGPPSVKSRGLVFSLTIYINGGQDTSHNTVYET